MQGAGGQSAKHFRSLNGTDRFRRIGGAIGAPPAKAAVRRLGRATAAWRRLLTCS
jgi:hypothetical protein